MLLSFVFLMSGSLMAAEVDNFTLRDVPLRDSLETINNKTNVLFQEALDLANGKGCSEEELYSRVREKFRYGFNKGEFIQWMKKEDSLDRVFVDYRDGIYRDLWIFNLVVPLTVPFAGPLRNLLILVVTEWGGINSSIFWEREGFILCNIREVGGLREF